MSANDTSKAKQTADHGHAVAGAGLSMAANALSKIHGQIMSAPDPNQGGTTNDDLLGAIQGLGGGGSSADQGGGTSGFPSLDPAVQQQMIGSGDPNAVNAYMQLCQADLQHMQDQQNAVIQQFTQGAAAPQGPPAPDQAPPGVGGEGVM
jgi:hypothetical protein